MAVVANHPSLNAIKQKLIKDLYQQLEASDENSIDRVILLTSLYRLGEQPDFRINQEELKNDMSSFYWFKANPFYGQRVWAS